MSEESNTKRSSINWRRHFLEFLMLFLAVFLGFFADNLRDKFSEKSKEKEYIRSLIQDVEIDKVNIEKTIKSNERRSLYLDSLSAQCYNYNPKNKDDRQLYYYCPIILLRPDFLTSNELTILQLKNGGMRFIRSKDVVREIFQYDLQVKKLANQQQYYENYQNNAINLGLKIFNLEPFKTIESKRKEKIEVDIASIEFKLIQNDKALLTEFGNVVNMYGGIVDYYNILLKNMNAQADTLIVKLEKDYNIK